MSTKITKENYKKEVKRFHSKPPYLINGCKAFLVGGAICAFGQLVSNFYMKYFNFTEQTVGNPTVATLIFIAAILTGFGVYDKIGQFAGAGSLVPVTGFSNAMASAALEHKSEGLVHGIAANMFKLAGSIIVYGVVAATAIGFIRYSVRLLLS